MIDNLKNLQLENFISIDVETTGLDIKQHKIIELAACRFENGLIVEKYSELVNPNSHISPFITELTGIKNTDVLDKPNIKDLSKEFTEFISDYPIVGHNIKFDIDFINNEFDDQINIKQNYLCDTFELSRIFLYHFNSFKLESLCSEFNIKISKSHRALDDAINTGWLFLKILDEINNSDLNSIHMLYKISQNTYIPNKLLIENIFKKNINVNQKRNLCIKEKECIYNYKSEKENLKSQHFTIDSLFKTDNILKNNMKSFEFRESQYHFSKDCFNIIKNDGVLIAEAGTGLGKSLGYLAASILNDKHKIIISTSTHNLQSQLLYNDVPNIAEVLNKSLKAVLIKGKNNYLCYGKLVLLIENVEHWFSTDDIKEIMALIVWANRTSSGDVNECNSFNIKRNLRIWDLLKYDAESCFKHDERSKHKCFYQNIIKHATDADIFIVNHALLVSNINKPDSFFNGNICIIDEAHKLVENCRSHLTETISVNMISQDYRSLNNLFNDIEKNINTNNLPFKDFKDCYEVLGKTISKFLNLFTTFITEYSLNKINDLDNKFSKYVIDKRYNNVEKEFCDISISFKSIIHEYKQILNIFEKLKDDLNLLNDNSLRNNKSKFNSIYLRFKKYGNVLRNIFASDLNVINWAKFYNNRNQYQCIFNTAPLNVDTLMQKIINKNKSTVFCSATLSIDGDFSYFLKETGFNYLMTDKEIKTEIYSSPFYYNDQIKLFMFNSNETIDSANFVKKISEMIMELRQKIQRRTLVLCTSYSQINNFKDFLSNKINSNIFYQSNYSSKQNLLKKYLLNSNSILFGTNTFWDGIDLPNEYLEVLIILKLPFANPNNPIVNAKIDYYNMNNIEPFYEYQIPETILKLRQGIGRLIRNENDAGVCIITDPRLVTKKYGKVITESLPAIPDITGNYSQIITSTQKFFGS